MEKRTIVLRDYRKKHGYTQTALANLIGVTHQTINNWEHGNAKPNEESIIKLARVFNVSPERLYDQMLEELSISKLRLYQNCQIKLYESIDLYVNKTAKCLIYVNYSDPDSLFAVKMTDDSMAEYHLPKDSTAIIRTKGLVMSGIIAIISIDYKTPRIAKIITDGNKLTLSFGSKKIPDEQYDLNKIHVEIIGRVIGYLGDI